MADHPAQPPRALAPAEPPTRVLDQPPLPPPARSLWSYLLLLVIVVLLAWLGFERLQRAQLPPPLIITIADTTPPTASFSENLPSSADGAIMSLVRGDCLTAAANFRTARRGSPEVGRLWVLEGAAFVCAGDAAEARDVLEEVTAATEVPPRQAWWYLAQACLMQGDIPCAVPALNQTILTDKRHRRKAEGQLRQLQAAQEQLQ
jgi:hypothetical protein